MKKLTSLWMVLAVAASAGTAFAQEDLYEDDLLEEPEDKLVWSIGGVHQIYNFQHSALQRRADDEFETSESWKDGRTTGNGWGMQLTASRANGQVNLIYVRSDYDYKLEWENGYHYIDTTRNDVELYWQQITGQQEYGFWGWQLGYNYSGTKKTITLIENQAHLSARDNLNWHMASAGYFGEYLPLKARYIAIYGAINALVGEVSGLSREGNDEDFYDGNISEQYKNDLSLAYGLNFKGGIYGIAYDRVRLGVDYRREWMYSFDSTSTGLTMFPDNKDALFIENTYSLYMYIDLSF
jgi:hypothetical protein